MSQVTNDDWDLRTAPILRMHQLIFEFTIIIIIIKNPKKGQILKKKTHFTFYVKFA